MQILIVSQYFWPENFRITDLARALKERGHELTVLTGIPNYPSGKKFEGYSWPNKCYEEMEGIRVYRVPLFLRRKGKSWQLMLNYLSFVISASLLGPWLLRNHQFDVVFVGGYSPFTVGFPAALLSKLKRVPMLYWLQDLWPESLSATGVVTSKRVLGLVGKMVKMMYGYCDRILVQSRGFVAPAINIGAKKEKILYFPNWAEPLYRRVTLPLDAPERNEVPTDGFIAMFAGNLGAAQSLETILDAAEQLKEDEVHWVFLGDGRKRNWLQDQKTSRGLDKVHILGRRDVGTMPLYFSLADAMLVTLDPDPAITTTIPGKIQSYLACGRPIVGALDGEGAKVIDESGSGITVPSGDAHGLAESILNMSKMNHAERQSMGDAALACYRQYFEREQLVSQLEQWMSDMTGGSR